MIYTKRNVRSTYRSNKRSSHSKSNHSYKASSSYYNNKPRLKGNISQLHDKYSKLAKEYAASGDRIQSEYYWQFVDHYSRTLAENDIRTNTNNEQNTSTNEEESSSDEKNQSLSENNNSEGDETSDSLETVSFISQPAVKSDKTKK